MLPAARTTEGMVEELLGWASQMPIFATHLTGAHLPFLPRSLHSLLMHDPLMLSLSSAQFRLCMELLYRGSKPEVPCQIIQQSSCLHCSFITLKRDQVVRESLPCA